MWCGVSWAMQLPGCTPPNSQTRYTLWSPTPWRAHFAADNLTIIVYLCVPPASFLPGEWWNGRNLSLFVCPSALTSSHPSQFPAFDSAFALLQYWAPHTARFRLLPRQTHNEKVTHPSMCGEMLGQPLHSPLHPTSKTDT